MIWLQKPQWVRWGVAVLVALAALWSEFGVEAVVEHPFAVAPVRAGEELNDANVEFRTIPEGVLAPVLELGKAAHDYGAGDPLTPGGVSFGPTGGTEGWWELEIDLPAGAGVGDSIRLLLLESGLLIEGVVAVVPSTDDPFGDATGSVAFPAEDAVPVAAAIATGRHVAMLESG